jgi:hypothetical protein
MVELIRSTKDTVLERLDKAINEKGADRMNVQEVGMLADVVKDLAEAEKSCWEAEYYMSVTEAMQDGSMGYEDAMGYRQGNSGSDRGGRGYRRGYRGQSRDSMGRYTSRSGYRRMDGYGHDDVMMDVREMMETVDPQEREEIKRKLREMTE